MKYQTKMKPFAHQLKALKKMEQREGFALLMAMRTGKSKTLLDNYGQLELDKKVDDLLIIAPAGVYRTWETAFKEHASYDLQKRAFLFTWCANMPKSGSHDIVRLFGHVGPRILLMNVEALSSVERAKDLVLKFLTQRRTMLAIDESTIIKNPQSKRTKFVVGLRTLATHRRILSGLPTPRTPLDLYSQFYFLDPKILGFTSYYAFRARYAVMRKMQFSGRSVPIVVGYRDQDELRERIEPFSFRVRLEDCYDMPKAVYMKREVPLHAEQQRIYNEMKLFATAKLKGEKFVTATQVITQILRLHQVLCGHTADEGGRIHQIPEHRTSELLALLEEYDGKAIIWCSYDQNIQHVTNALLKEYGKGSVARFWGGNRSEREDEEKRFLNDPACRFMVATPAAGGRGRTWTVADLVVYYSSTDNLEHRSQSEERPKAVNKVRPITYVDLVAPGTVDERIIKALRAKINMAATITGDTWQEWLI